MRARRSNSKRRAAAGASRPSAPVVSPVWMSVALVALTVAVFGQVRHFEFVTFDDPLYVTENTHIAQGVTATAVRWAFTATYAANWHPLTWLSHMLDVELFGLNPGAHHLTSLAFHIANTLLLFGVLRRLTNDVGASAVVAAMFAVHPLHVESVAWVAERKDVLSTFFWLLTFRAYVSYVERPGGRRYAIVVILYVLGLMSKPMLVGVPLTLLLLDYWPLGRLSGGRASWWPAIREKLPLVGLAMASAAVTYLAQRQGAAMSTLTDVSLPARIANALHSYVGYLETMFWPAELAGFYPLQSDLGTWSTLGAAAILAAVSVAAVIAARRAPYVAMGWWWYVGTLVPVIGLVQVGVQAMADRYTYVPMIGVLIAVTWTIARLPVFAGRRGRRVLGVIATAFVMVLAVLAHAQAQQWSNSTTFWTRAATVSFAITDYDAHLGIGRVLAGQGRLTEALAHLSEAVRLRPDSAQARHALGVVVLALNRSEDAVTAFTEAVRLQPDSALMQNDLGWALFRTGRVDEARARFAEAIRLKPDFGDAHNNMGLTYARAGRLPEALPFFAEAVRVSPALEEPRINLARTLAGLGRLTEAREQLAEVLRRNPGSAPARQLLDELAKRS
jgi:Flp pilus assembly protein TadD